MKDFYKSKSPLFAPVPRPLYDHLPGRRPKQELSRTIGDQTANRFRDLDELRFSMRSVAENAGQLFRKIHLLTTEVVEDREDGSQVRYGQTPRWLKQRTAGAAKDDEEIDDRVELVLHKDIFDDPAHLPSFNSLAIESQMHHVPGLADVVSFSILGTMALSPHDHSLFFHKNCLCVTGEHRGKSNGSTGENQTEAKKKKGSVARKIFLLQWRLSSQLLFSFSNLLPSSFLLLSLYTATTIFSLGNLWALATFGHRNMGLSFTSMPEIQSHPQTPIS